MENSHRRRAEKQDAAHGKKRSSAGRESNADEKPSRRHESNLYSSIPTVTDTEAYQTENFRHQSTATSYGFIPQPQNATNPKDIRENSPAWQNSSCNESLPTDESEERVSGKIRAGERK